LEGFEIRGALVYVSNMETPELIKLPIAALGPSMKALRRLASYELESGIHNRMQELGERKESLNETEHAELMSLVEFSEQRTIEKLEAEVALQRLHTAAPELLAS
jgi:hypothetical protein